MPDYDSYRSRKERMIRYVTRRRPCAVLVVIQCIIIVLLCIALYWAYRWLISLQSELEVLERENKVIEEYKRQVKGETCDYSEAGPFDTSLCESDDDANSHSYRVRAANKTPGANEEKQCLHRMEIQPCADHNLLYKNRFENVTVYTTNFTECSGLFATKLEGYISPLRRVYVPLVDGSTVPLGRIFRASEVVGGCPTCMFSSNYMNLTEPAGACGRSIVTLKMGFPMALSVCDSLELHPQQQFCQALEGLVKKDKGDASKS